MEDEMIMQRFIKTCNKYSYYIVNRLLKMGMPLTRKDIGCVSSLLFIRYVVDKFTEEEFDQLEEKGFLYSEQIEIIISEKWDELVKYFHL